jgi:hypothetical protein
VTRHDVAAALRIQLEDDVGAADALDPAELHGGATAHLERFTDPQWTWRR